MPRRDRQRVPLVWGEGLERERGLMAAQATDFFDLRNVLLHEGSVMLRPGFAASGTFDEVDRLIAGHAIRNEALGIVVGYSSTTERVYVYRVSTDLELVELLGEWEHDLSSGWGAVTPRIIMCEVNGRIFMAHDESLVTRRAYTLYYDPITGDDVLNVLQADFAGTSTTGESESVVAEADAVRFRGVVRHLSYLVGWGFGTAEEPRPELVRISLPDDPTTFDPLHYKVAGDRRDAVLACGPSGTGPTGTVLNVWKRTETYAIPGTDRRSFGIQLVDPRHGIVSSRAWLNLEGVAIAWGEEGPRLFSGLGASHPLDLPLGLENWEPDDLPAEGPSEAAFTQYVPRERVGLFVFGRRVYALTARVQGRWRWSTWELGFDPYGPVTLFGTTEEQEAPEAVPDFDDAEPAGSYADIDVLHNLALLRGNETLEVWLAVVESGSGGTSSPAPGVIQGVTDFSEFEVGAGVPDGITERYLHASDRPTVVEIKNDAGEGNWLSLSGGSSFWQHYLYTVDSLAGTGVQRGEMLGRVYVSALGSNNRYWAGLALGGAEVAAADGSPQMILGQIFARNAAGDHEAATNVRQANGTTGNLGLTDLPYAETAGWYWIRFQVVDEGSLIRRRLKMWTGALEDEPGSWIQDGTLGSSQQDLLEAVTGDEFGIGSVSFAEGNAETGVAFLSFSSDPTFPPIAPDEVPSGEMEWFRARSVAVSLSGSQRVRVTGLTPGTQYAVALRYRVGLQYSPGASNTADPEGWPSISQGDFMTTVDPPEILSAVWSRTSDSAERITLELEPVEGVEDQDIVIWRRVGTAGAWTELDTIAGPHVGTVEYVDDTISGETVYQYSASTGTGAQGPATRIWSGPATIPAMSYRSPFGAGYIVGFTPGNAALATELHDTYDDAGGVEAASLRATAAAGAVEVQSGTLENVPAPDFTFSAKLRHKATAFTVDDFGEFSAEFDVTVPESE